MVYKDLFPVMETVLASGVTLLGGLQYHRVDGYRPLTLDLYSPSKKGQPHPRQLPLLIYIHGGGWRRGDSHRCGVFTDFPRLLGDIASRGYVVAAVNYRLSSEAKWPAQIDDIRTAVSFLLNQADAFGIDPQRVYAWGVSAGAQLAASLGNPTESVSSQDQHCPVTASVHGVAAWYGVFDFTTLGDQALQLGIEIPDDAPEWRLIGAESGQDRTARIRSASPAFHTTSRTSPMLILAGKKDRKVPYLQSMQMKDALDRVGVPNFLCIYEKVGHSFICEDEPAETNRVNLSAINKTIDFFDALAF